ncbi:hypothetical protein [uncultured Aquimarina sp.]|uniref:hypothetical protein n=1 Tax=uncultured Aquimarina sp. TaxID=575652 RepID=UPI00260200BA|nr:hypothetical protein [uncultured Aquimarina sp.]
MKNVTLLCALFLLTMQTTFAQVFPGDYLIDEQSDIDLFNYTTITGDLIIKEGSPGAISNLNGLSELTFVSGNVIITENRNLQNLDGLSNMNAGDFTAITISKNASLNNVNGLSGITLISQRLVIEDNIVLDNLDGLENVVFIDSAEGFFLLRVRRNSSLANACGIINIINYDQSLVTVINSINSNGPNTSSVEDVIANCITPSCEGIYPDNLVLDSQSAIDAFNYCEVAGSLTIEELVTGDIVDLSPLNVLENLGGDLKIYRNKALTEINGFQNLTTINGTLELRGNTLVTNIDGLSNITALERLELFNNFKLENIDALSNITELTDVRITNNNLTNLYGLRNLETITNSLYLNNTKLINLDDLNNLQTIVKAMYLYSNGTLENVNGLQNMIVGNAIHINNNVSLKNLDGLNKVSSLNKDLIFKNNTGLENACGIKQLLAENAVDGTISISMNGPNASSINAIMNNCLPSLGLVMYPTVGYGNHMIVEGIKAPSFTYMIHNLSGILLEQGTISNANDINTVIFRNVLGPGNYIFTVEESGQRTSVQFVVQF